MKKTVLLIDIDSKIPNLALHKIAIYHARKGDEVIWNLPMMRHAVDKIYASCIFSRNKEEADEWAEYGAIVGGTGFDLKVKLPPEIDDIECRINWGFTSRGCIRNCKFCVVREKEGFIHATGDIYSIWDGKSKDIVLMDNNILAIPEHFHVISKQIQKERLRVDFNQGLDHRLLTPEICKSLKMMRHNTYKFAFDHPSMTKSVIQAVKMLDAAGIKQSTWYVLVNYDTTFDEDMDRLRLLKLLGQRAFLMRYNNKRDSMLYNDLASWTSMRQYFSKMTFEQFRSIRHKSVKIQHT